MELFSFFRYSPAPKVGGFAAHIHIALPCLVLIPLLLPQSREHKCSANMPEYRNDLGLLGLNFEGKLCRVQHSQFTSCNTHYHEILYGAAKFVAFI